MNEAQTRLELIDLAIRAACKSGDSPRESMTNFDRM